MKVPRQADQIVDHLREADGGSVTRAEVVDLLGTTPGSAAQLLSLLVKEGRLVRTEHGVYALPAPALPEPAALSPLAVHGPSAVIVGRAVAVPVVDSAMHDTGEVEVADRLRMAARGFDDGSLRRFFMPSDAMVPTLTPGTPLDLVPGGYDGAGIYLVRLDDHPDVCRVQLLPGRAVRLAYDNASYHDVTLRPAAAPGRYTDMDSGLDAAFEVVAKVRGSYQRH